eukprot:CAMPEP_0194288090 /NCGR_PEP_ID=MMETSP0169-20130528/36099_1 /TAXON_ID=218684 /ORGANISM="Corethron pennatum, Strain L29A3" /LENGTH=375 /DNA_ID=CAMNT_0039034995 /DNA_START=607 /DNA_END=1734 /DNA_ORIENTATION=+
MHHGSEYLMINTYESDSVMSKVYETYARSALEYSNDDDSHLPSHGEVYVPSSLEQYFIKNLDNLGYDSVDDPDTCNIYKDPNITTPSIHAQLIEYSGFLDTYENATKNFEPIPDLLKEIQTSNSHDVCKTARLDPNIDDIRAFFPGNNLCSTQSGFIEPLLPPMRHHGICTNVRAHLFDMNYLVHDFEAMCRKLKPTSKRILIDMGASLLFHAAGDVAPVQPVVNLINLYKKFGFHFDHIYGFEVTPFEAEKVYKKLLTKEYMASYHWINVGVTKNKKGKLNPLHSIVKQYSEDDLIIVKLDIDTASIEVSLAHQLLQDKDNVYHKLIDQFYFEHHVHQKELAPFWKLSMEGTIKDSFKLFHGLRKKGIPTHFWP